MTQTIKQSARELLAKHYELSGAHHYANQLRNGYQGQPQALAALTEAITRIEELEGALRPFAVVGKIIDGPFGPALFAEDDMAFSSGCAWTENGEKKTLTWGDFRRATLSKGITE